MPRCTIRRLMLVIAGIALWLGGVRFLSGPFDRVSGCSRQNQCAHNLRIITLAALNYASNEDVFPPGTWPNPDLPPEQRLSWYAPMMPYLDNQELWLQVAKDWPWHEKRFIPKTGYDSNWKIAGMHIGILCCPSQTGPPKRLEATPYIGIAGLGTDAPTLPTNHPRAGIFGYDRTVTFLDLRDGASNTMMIAESSRTRGSWLAGGPATVRGLDTIELPYIGQGRQFGGLHGSGAYVAFVDGSVRYISDTINPRVFEAISTIAGGEHLPMGSFDP